MLRSCGSGISWETWCTSPSSNRTGSRRGNPGGRDTPTRSVHRDESTREQELVLGLDENTRQGAKKMLAQVLLLSFSTNFIPSTFLDKNESHHSS